MDLEPPRLISMFRQMVLIRRFEERAIELRMADRIHGSVHPCIGQEAVAVGVCAGLRPTDRIVSNHRGHGHCIAKGADTRRMMAELFGRRDGYCKGKGGSMHIADFDIGLIGANGIVAAGLPIAAGSALSAQVTGTDVVTVCFFGDGATGGGAFHETLNISALWKLPVVWVCENNQYASDTRVEEEIPVPDVATFAQSYNIPGVIADGNDPLAAYEAATAAVARARRGEGPTLLECKTFRMAAHRQRRVKDAETRPVEELDFWSARDPIAAFERRLVDQGILAAEQVARIRASVEDELALAVAFAEASPFPAPEEALEDMWAEQSTQAGQGR